MLQNLRMTFLLFLLGVQASASGLECPPVVAPYIPSSFFSAEIQTATIGYISEIKNDHAPKTRKYLERILGRLIRASKISIHRYPNFPLELQVRPYEDDFEAYQENLKISISAQWLLSLADESQIAGLLAHELAHFVLAHEELRRIQTPPRGDPPVDLIRVQEAEADRYALRMMYQAGYSPISLASAIQFSYDVLGIPIEEINAAHPEYDPLELRLKKIKDQVDQCYPNNKSTQKPRPISSRIQERTKKEMF